MTPSLLLDPLPQADHNVTLNREQTRYVARVLRLKTGDPLFLFDGHGGRCQAHLTEITPRGAVVRCEGAIPIVPESPLHVTLMQGIAKGEKMDAIVQKATELGVYRIVPVITERSQAQKVERVDRWIRIAESAAAQCGRSVVPEISPILKLADALGKEPRRGFVFWERATVAFSHPEGPAAGNDLTVLIGPEGGLTDQEVALAETAGLKMAALGPRILRTETAAIIAVALVQYLAGDMGS